MSKEIECYLVKGSTINEFKLIDLVKGPFGTLHIKTKDGNIIPLDSIKSRPTVTKNG